MRNPSFVTGLSIFNGYSETEVLRLLDHTPYRIRNYSKNSIILFQGCAYTSIYLLIRGSCTGEMNSYEGKTVKLESFHAPDVIAPGILFSEHPEIPVSLRADSDVEILLIRREDFLNLITCEQLLLKNFLQSISDKIALLSHKVEFFSFKSIRAKVAHYLLSQSREKTSFTIMHSIEKLSLFFGVARQSVSRVLQEMEEEGLFIRQGKKFYRVKPEELKKHERNS